jgi:hypothetical protein
MKHLKVLAFLGVMILLGGSCKHDPPVGPKTKCDTCITPCDTCHTDTTHHATSNDTSSHNFSWSQSSILGDAGLSGCWVFGPKDIYVVGGAVWKYDGAKWTNVSPTDQRGVNLSGGLSGFSMFAQSESDYWLTYAGNVINVSGLKARLFLLDSLKPGFLHSSWGTSSSDIYSAGDGGTILHFDGTAWTKMASGTTKNLYSIWGTGDNNIWAAGFYSTTAETGLVHFNGTSWQSIDPKTVGNIGPGADGVQAVWTCDSAGVPITVFSGSSVWRQSGSGSWRSDAGKVPNDLSGGGNVGLYELTGNTANDIMAAGGWGWIGHWNGRSWKRYDALYDLSNGSYAAGGISMKDSTACVVGLKNGNSWIAIGQR